MKNDTFGGKIRWSLIMHCICLDVIEPFNCNTNKRSFHFNYKNHCYLTKQLQLVQHQWEQLDNKKV